MANFNNVSTAYQTVNNPWVYPQTTATPWNGYQQQVGGINFAPQNQQMIPQAQPSYQQNGLIWVKGMTDVDSYQIQPGQTVALWDSDEQVVYIKSADQTGRPSVTVLDYTDRNVNNQEPNYATVDQVEALQNQISDIAERLNNMKPKQNNRRDVNQNGKSSV